MAPAPKLNGVRNGGYGQQQCQLAGRMHGDEAQAVRVKGF